MRFSFLNILKSCAPTTVLVLALPLVAQRAEVPEPQGTAQLTFAPSNPETMETAPSADVEPKNRVEGYFALAGFALVAIFCRKQ